MKSNLIFTSIIIGILASSCSNEDFIMAEPIVSNDISKTSLLELEGEKIFNVVEKHPEFPGGIPKMYEFIGNEIIYPKNAQERGIEGRVFIKFIVDKNGNVQKPEILKGTFPDIDEEALRVINKMPKWEPGKQNGKAVNTYFTMPIAFKLE